MVIVASPTSGSAAQVTPEAAVEPVAVTFATADGSTFRTALTQPADIAAAQDALAGDGNAGIPNGTLAYGDGGINAPHEWHMEGTTLAEVTIELCDGTATMVDDDVAYWVETVGQFCPWNATVVAIDPMTPPNNGEDPNGGGEDDASGDGISDLPATGAGIAANRSSSETLATTLGALAILLGIASLFWIRRSRSQI
jgi:hypothetical protein